MFSIKSLIIVLIIVVLYYLLKRRKPRLELLFQVSEAVRGRSIHCPLGFVSILCPVCGNKLEIALDSKAFTCKYCRGKIKVEDAIDYYSAIKPPKNKKDLIQHLELLEKHFSKVTNIRLKIFVENEKLQKIQRRTTRFHINLLLLIILAFLLIGYLVQSNSTYFFWVLSIFIIFNLICELRNEYTKKEAPKRIAQYAQQIEENEETVPETFVAPEFRNIIYVNRMLKKLKEGKADNYWEALGLVIQDIQYRYNYQHHEEEYQREIRRIDLIDDGLYYRNFHK